MKNARVVLSLCSAGALSLGLIGCAAKPVAQRAAGPQVASEETSNSVVFGSADMLAMTGGRQIAQSDWRDESMNIRSLRSAYEQAAWPDIARPSLARARRATFSSQSNSITYFRAEGVTVRNGREYVLP